MCCNHSKIWTLWLYYSVMSPNEADGMANSVDPDQTAPLGAVWSGSALFAQAYLSETLGSLQLVNNSKYTTFIIATWATTWQNQQSDCAPSKDSAQPGHPPSLIRVFAVRLMGS